MGRRHVAMLMRRMGITAIYRMPRTSLRHPAHRLYPYLLRQLTIARPNHVWAADIAYLPMKRGFVYRCAIRDWASRRVLAWRLSNTLTTDFCTFCAACVAAVLHNVCPNCGGGFVPRPIRPSKNWKGNNYLGNGPASTTVKHRPVDPTEHHTFVATLKIIPPEKRQPISVGWSPVLPSKPTSSRHAL